MEHRVRATAVVGVAVGTALLLACGRVFGAEAAIDLFTDASALTQFVVDTNVRQDTVGSTVRVDPGLSGVIGEVRQLTVTMSSALLPPLDAVVSGVQAPPIALLEYASSSGADGNVELLYDRNGNGLNATLAFAQGIRLIIAAASLQCVTPGLDLTVTLTDSFLMTAASTQTVTLAVMPGMPLTLDFPFSAFAGVDPISLFSIAVAIDPQPSELGGCDMELEGIRTFGTPTIETICDDGIDNNNNGFIDCADLDCENFPGCPHPAPALSPSGLGTAVALVAMFGVVGILRRRRTARQPRR